MSEPEPRKEEDETPLTGSAGDAAAPMRLRAEAPRVTRLSRKVLAGIGLVASVGIGGALIYALQTRDGGRPADELYSTDNRSTADGLAGLPRDYSGVPQLGPPLPGDLGRPILGAQNRGQPLPNQPNPGLSAEEQRRLQEIETARVSRLFSRHREPAHGFDRPRRCHDRAAAGAGPRQPRPRTAARHSIGPGSAARVPQCRRPTGARSHRIVSPRRRRRTSFRQAP